MRPLLLSTALILSLTACSWDPSFMPSGYAHHGGAFNAPPGPKAPSIGYEYSAKENEQHIMAWRFALRDLLLRAKEQNLDIPQTIHLTTDLDNSGLRGGYDYALREGLREYGHVLSTSEGDTQLFYSAYAADAKAGVYSVDKRTYNGDIEEDTYYENVEYEKTRNMELIIGVLQDGRIVRGIRGIYEMPVDGYHLKSYVDDDKNPLKKNPMTEER